MPQTVNPREHQCQCNITQSLLFPTEEEKWNLGTLHMPILPLIYVCFYFETMNKPHEKGSAITEHHALGYACLIISKQVM